MIRAAMPELKLVSASAERKSQYLVAKADAENRRLADQTPNVVDLRMQRLRIARTVREKDAVGLQREDILGGGERGHHRDFASRVHQSAQNVLLDPKVV